MKKIILLFIAILITTYSLYAIPASPEAFIYTQPDGSKLTLYQRGDEYFHWTETDNNDVVIKNGEWYEYATIINNQIVASGIVVSRGTSYIAKSQLSTRDELMELIHKKRSIAIAQIDSINKLNNSDIKSTPLTEGNLKVLCILIGFPDKPFTKTTTDYENMWNQIGYNYEGSQGSVKDFYLENSYGLLNVTATVVGPYTASHSSSYYDTGEGISSSKVRTLIREAMQAARNDVQFSDFDLNQNYYVDLVHVIFAGYAQEVLGSSGVIWSHHWTLSTPVWQGLYRAKDYICTSELAGSIGTKVAPMGTVCHEYGHDLGAPDYYDSNSSGFKGTGYWDVMCNGSWNNYGRCPAHHNPYTKTYIYNWATPTIISSTASDALYTLTPSHNTPSFYRINTSTNGEFFLLENKKKLGFNSHVVSGNKDGLLIYHIHKDIQDAISNNSVNTSHPQKCYIVNANATSNPNNLPSSYGLDYSVWAYPTNSKRFFRANSIPSATSWVGTPTGVNIWYIQKIGNNIKFIVNPYMRGNASLCSSNQYVLNGIPSSATINWSYETNIQQIDTFPVLRLSSTTSSSITVQRGEYRYYDGNISGPTMLYSGNVTLKATVVCEGDTNIYTKTLIMHEDEVPTLPATSLTQIGWQESRTFTINNCTNVSDNKLKWIITLPNATTSTTYYGRSWSFSPTGPGTLNIKLYNLENCSTALHSNYNIIVNWFIPIDLILLFPNPTTTGSVEIHVKDKNYTKRMDLGSEETVQSVDYTLELWDNNSRFVKTISSVIKGEEDVVTLDVSGLQNGVYVLNIKVQDKIVSTDKMIIRH